MGAWGVYDDESDDSCMIFDTLIGVIEKEYKIDDLYDRNKFIQVRKEKTFYPLLINFFKKMRSNWDIVGCAVSLAKLMNDKNIQVQPLYGIPPESNLCCDLPKDFPGEICEIVEKSIYYLLKNKNVNIYSDEKERIDALNQELYLFTRGQKGYRGEIIQNSFQKWCK